MKKALFNDMVKYLPAQIVPGIVGFLTIPIITRLFSSGDYGNYVLVTAAVSVFSTIVSWLSMSIIRFYPAYERDGKLNEFYGNIIKLTVISITVVLLVALGILVILKPYISMKLYSLMWIGMPVFILTSGFGVLLYFLRAKRWVGWYGDFRIWNSITAISFGILLVVVFHFGVSSLLWGSILSSVIILPFLWKKVIAGVSLVSKRISLPLVLEMAKYSFPLVIGSLVGWILSLSDRYIIGFFQGNQEVGIYSVNYAIAENIILLFGSLFMLAAGPLGINIWEKEGKERSQRFVNELSRYYLIVCLPAVVGLSILAKPFVSVFIAQEYCRGYRIIPLVALGVFFLNFQQIFQLGLHFHKKTHFIMFSVFISGLLNLGLNFLLIPKYGYIAAAATTLVSYTFLLFLMVVTSRRLFIWEFPFKSLGKVICASTVMGMAVYFVSNSLTSLILLNLILSVIVGVVVYFAILILLQEFRQDEIQKLLNLGSRIVERISK